MAIYAEIHADFFQGFFQWFFLLSDITVAVFAFYLSHYYVTKMRVIDMPRNIINPFPGYLPSSGYIFLYQFFLLGTISNLRTVTAGADIKGGVA